MTLQSHSRLTAEEERLLEEDILLLEEGTKGWQYSVREGAKHGVGSWREAFSPSIGPFQNAHSVIGHVCAHYKCLLLGQDPIDAGGNLHLENAICRLKMGLVRYKLKLDQQVIEAYNETKATNTKR